MQQFLSDIPEFSPADDAALRFSSVRMGRTLPERLLRVLAQVAPVTPLPDVLVLLARQLNEMLPTCSIAVSIPASKDNPPVFVAIPNLDEPFDKPASGAVSPFPSCSHARAFSLDVLRPDEAWFHCASSDPTLDDDASGLSQTLEGCSVVFALAVRLCDAQQAMALRDHDAAKSERFLRQSDKLAVIGQLLTGLAHELASPLTVIVAHSDELLRKAEQRGKSQEDTDRFRRIGEAAQLVLDFTRSFTAYARAENDAPSPVDVASVIEQAVRFCRHVVLDASVDVSVNVEGNPVVSMVRSRLIQVIVNLVTNACQAMAPNGGKLDISARVNASDATVLICVADTGPGIASENVERLFDAFFTTKAEGEGTGLGLHIVRQIVTSARGSVEVESVVGEGARFVVRLPGLVGSC